MFNLIIVLISVALVIGLTIVSVFYAGDIVSESKTKAVAATFDNQASQIYSASLLYYQDKGTWPVDVSLLYLEGKKYLSAEITPPATMVGNVKSAVLSAFAQTPATGAGGIVNGSTEIKPYVGDANAFMATMVQNKALTEKRLNKIKAVIGDDPEKLAYIAGMYNEVPKAGELKKTDWAWSDDSDIPAKRYVKVSGKVASAVCKHVNVRSGKAANSEVEVHKVFDPNYKIQCFGDAEPYTYLFLTPEADPQVINNDPPPESLCADGVSSRDSYGHCPCAGKPWYPLANGVCPDSWKVTLVTPSGVCNNPTTSLSGKVTCPPGGGSAGGSTMHDYGADATADLPMSAGPSGGAGSCPVLPAGSTMVVTSYGNSEAYFYEGAGVNYVFDINPAQVCKCEDGSLPVPKGTGDNRHAVCNPEKDPVAGACPAGYSLTTLTQASTGAPQYASPNTGFVGYAANFFVVNKWVAQSSSTCSGLAAAYGIPFAGVNANCTYKSFYEMDPNGDGSTCWPCYAGFGGGSAPGKTRDTSCPLNYTLKGLNSLGTYFTGSAGYYAQWTTAGITWWREIVYSNASVKKAVQLNYRPGSVVANTVQQYCERTVAHQVCPDGSWALSGTTCSKQVCTANVPVAAPLDASNSVADSPKNCDLYASSAALATECRDLEITLPQYLKGEGYMKPIFDKPNDNCKCEWTATDGSGVGSCKKDTTAIPPEECPNGFFEQVAATAGLGDCDIQRNVPCGSNGSASQAAKNFAGAATGTAICTLGNGMKWVLDASVPSAQAAGSGPTPMDICQLAKATTPALICDDTPVPGKLYGTNPNPNDPKLLNVRGKSNQRTAACTTCLSPDVERTPAQEALCQAMNC